MPVSFPYEFASTIIANARRDIGGTGASTDAQWPASAMVVALNRAIKEMQNFMDFVSQQFMTKIATLSRTDDAGTVTPNFAPDGSAAYVIGTYAAGAGIHIHFRLSDFRRAIALTHAPATGDWVRYRQIQRGMGNTTTLGFVLSDSRVFSLDKSGGEVGEYEITFVAATPPSGGSLRFEYSYYHPEVTEVNIATQYIYIEPSFYTILSLWTALIALSTLPDQAYASSILMRLSTQRIPDSTLVLSETESFNNLLAGMYGRRESPVTQVS